jgi:RsiW-degrading membrane proteinase PrsW (M82 family)
MLEQMLGFLMSWFANPSLVGIGLAILFGAIWLVGYWPPLFKKPWLWAVLAISAILSLLAVSFIQIPLQVLAGRALGQFWSQELLIRWLLLAGIPQILLTGLVQEGSKLVPVVLWWLGEEKNLDVKTGLMVGAVAGFGFGVFEAIWAHNSIFAAGWTWEAVQIGGYMALAGFWERFFAVAFHIASCALAGWGLARGWGWQFYLLAAFLHSLLNYSVVLLQTGLFTIVHLEIYAAVVAVLVTAGALRLRWRKTRETGGE